ncbi:MAG: hypothetical protein IJ068_04345 [Bacilli bacterium]|nr:hypothetical protein [Bacilli bacterium]
MLKEEKDLNFLIDEALEESKIYLDMYKDKLKHYQDDLKKLEENKDEFIDKNSLFKYESKKHDYLKAIEKYKIEIKNEKDSIDRLLNNKQNN